MKNYNLSYLRKHNSKSKTLEISKPQKPKTTTKYWKTIEIPNPNMAELWQPAKINKDLYCKTRAGKKYYDELALYTQQEKCRKLRAKLEYQMKTYGQVDEFDFQEFVLAGKICQKLMENIG